MRYLNLLLCVAGMMLSPSCTNNKTPNVSTTDNSSEIIMIDGSSTVYPILKNAAEIYKQEYTSAQGSIITNFSGTTKGFEKLISGEADLIGASRPINMKEDRACRATDLEYIELMIGYDGIVIATHVQNKWANSITRSELKKLWMPESQLTVTSWKDVNAVWPKAPVHLYGAGRNSGTYDYFTEAIVGTTRHSRRDFIASEDDNYLVYKVSTDSLALGFFGYHYFVKNKHILKALAVDNESGLGPVFPNDSTIKNDLYRPLSRPIFIYVSKESLRKDSVKKFLHYFTEHLPVLVQTSEYISPTPQQLQTVKEKINKQIVGSEFVKSKDYQL
ncbi:MAG TPA: PstS family phosphate ABC transporter substrate-binding protein [Cytophagaceae bacterium]|nr:PstS family phosphate ABC transporter substrate-binding protein [Cytophagaceae bacterium]